VRARLLVKIYVAGLYLTEGKTTTEGVLALPGPKRVILTMLRRLTAEQFIDALNDGIEANSPAAEVERLKPRIDELIAAMTSIQQARKGDVIALDFLPESGTRIMVNGEVRSKPIPGGDFYSALLRVWLGDRPFDRGLKRGLLGQTG
jgi:hypothetical protein